VLTRFQRAGQEMRRANSGVEGAERLLHGLPPDEHDIRWPIQASLHGIDDGLMLPALGATPLTVVHRGLIGQVGQLLAQ